MAFQQFPAIEVNLDAIRNNAGLICGLCRQYGISVAGVVKVTDGDPLIAGAYRDGGCAQIAVSRVSHLHRLKKALPDVETLLTRSPILEEISETARYCDLSMHSEEVTLRALDKAAERLQTRPGVILMLDIGDLREGVPSIEELCRLAVLTERELPHIRLRGIGASVACLNGVLPDPENLQFLAEGAHRVEEAIGRPLEIVSGGSSVNLPLLQNGNRMPPEINHLRLGGSIINPGNIRRNRGFVLPGLREDSIVLTAEIIEIQDKDSVPKHASARNWAGEEIHTADRGVRRRAIVSLGCQDVGDAGKLFPMDPGMELIGCSSDHTVLDLTDSVWQWRVGDKVSFYMQYAPMLYAFSGRHVAVRHLTDSGALV